MCRHHSCGALYALHPLPSLAVVFSGGPQGCFQVGVVDFSCMHTIECDGRRLCFPGVVGDDGLSGSIGIGQLQLQSQTFVSKL